MLQWGGCTDVGKTRPINEDGYYISDYSKKLDAGYAMVADGMGGHQAGEVASKLAVRCISEIINEKCHGKMNVAEIKELLGTAIKQANSLIYEKGREEGECQGMGTTLTLLFIKGDTGVVAHVGDSRAYLLREGKLHQITTDHSLVQMLLSRGQITEEEAATHPQKNVITRALGTDSDVEIDLYEFAVSSGDIMLLGSDGLSNMLSADELTAMLQKGKKDSLDSLAKALVEEANSRGGLDNITAVLGRKK